MNSFNVSIGPVSIVLTAKALQSLLEQKQRYPYLPDFDSLQADLYTINKQGGIPAIVIQNRQGKEQLLLYTSSYYITLYESSHHDGYTVGSVDSLNLREHERLSKGALRLRAYAWFLLPELRAIPRGSNNFWTQIHRAWHDFELFCQQTNPQVKQQLFHAHERYLDMIDDLIDVTRQLEEDKSRLEHGIPYKKVESTGVERDAPRDVYTFRLADFPHIDEKGMLRLRGVNDLRGRVEALDGTKLTLKFETLIDRKRIPEQGYLEPMISQLIYFKQHDAVERLRTQQSKNTHLLSVLVDHNYQSYVPDRISQSNDDDLKSLTGEQFDAFRRALATPDVLMVLGPPGTGKTRTITEIARHCGFRHQRVLMTAGTHRAVDNVLERLPDDLIVIRVGHEDNVTETMRPKMIDAQAQKLQAVILENTENAAARYYRLLSYKHEIDAWVYQLTQGTAQLSGYETSLQPLCEQCNNIGQQIIAPFKGKFDELAARLQQHQAYFLRLQEHVNMLESKKTKDLARSSNRLLGWVFRMFVKHYASRIEQEQETLQETYTYMQQIQQEQTKVYTESQEALSRDGTYQRYNQQIHYLTGECEKMWQELLKIAKTLQATIADMDFVTGQPALTSKSAATLQRYVSWFSMIRARLERRAKLLKDWREELEKPTDQLYPELLRYADVVGATCIGTATAKGLEDIEFDLAIVDEAGQIGLPDLLVPLVRAKRAVLVGDYQQLPPFVDGEVQNWLKNLSPHVQSGTGEIDEEVDTKHIANLLTKSAFELLFLTNNDSAHAVRFTQQGRMPRVIADFASRHFYNNLLRTFSDEKMRHTLDCDPLFRFPLAVIDTSDVPFSKRREQEQRRLESLGETGYTSPMEAELIADLATVYQRTGKEWVVIVPYRAQARLIIQELSKRIEALDFTLEERVSTVDSFQGGERKKVIYGFTRSNEHGKIGFLKELRRLNVAMTRAQQQLVLIGDFSTLTKADNTRFKFVMSDLQTYAMQYGELLSSTQCYQRLQSALEGKRV